MATQVRVLLLLVCCLLFVVWYLHCFGCGFGFAVFLCVSGSGPTNWSLFIGRSKVDI